MGRTRQSKQIDIILSTISEITFVSSACIMWSIKIDIYYVSYWETWKKISYKFALERSHIDLVVTNQL